MCTTITPPPPLSIQPTKNFEEKNKKEEREEKLEGQKLETYILSFSILSWSRATPAQTILFNLFFVVILVRGQHICHAVSKGLIENQI